MLKYFPKCKKRPTVYDVVNREGSSDNKLLIVAIAAQQGYEQDLLKKFCFFLWYCSISSISFSEQLQDFRLLL